MSLLWVLSGPGGAGAAVCAAAAVVCAPDGQAQPHRQLLATALLRRSPLLTSSPRPLPLPLRLIPALQNVDNLLAIILGNCLGGVSIGWWKWSHNVHHIVTNSVEHDPDIQVRA